jgi:iron complex outermembrane receptor protein
MLTGLLGTVSLLSLAQIGQADGQTTDTTSATGTTLEEVVVTARRREEKAQSVPLTIQTFTQAAIEQQEITTVNDLQRDVPGFTICCAPGSDAFAWIRGVPGVLGYFAQTPTTLNGNALYFDQGSVQVLKGPQGTLFGLSTNGGAILFEPKAPTNDYEGFVEAEVGDYNHYELQAVVNVPVIDDKLLVRAGVQRYSTDGYIHDIALNTDLANQNYWVGRLSVTMRPTDDFQNTTVVNYYNSLQFDTGQDFVLAQFRPSTPGSPSVLAEIYGYSYLQNVVLAQQHQLGWYTIEGNHFLPDAPHTSTEQWNIVNTTTWDLNDELTIKNIAGYEEIDTNSIIDIASLPIITFDVGVPSAATGPAVQYTEELQLQGHMFNDKLTFTIGTFDEWSAPAAIGAGGSLTGGRAPHSIQYNDTFFNITGTTNTSTDRTNAVYGQGTYDLSDFVPGLSFTGGYRYTWDKVYSQSNSYAANGTLLSSQPGLVGHFHPSAPGSYTLSLDYQMEPQVLFYVTDSLGYSSGGFNNGTTLPPALQTFGPESLNEVEIGTKSDFEFLGIKARTNLAAYWGDYENIKVNVTSSVAAVGGGTTLQVLTLNAATGTVEGIEGQFTIIPVDSVELGGDFSYNHNTYDKYNSLNAVTGQVQNLDDTPFSFDPRWQYTLRATYHLPVDKSYGDISLTANYDWQGRMSNTAILPQAPQNLNPAFDNLDMSLNWRQIWGNPDLDGRFYVTNLLENRWAAGQLGAWQSLGIIGWTVARPRMFGASLRYTFGPGSEASAQHAAAYVPPPVQAPVPAPVAHSYMVFFDFNKSDLTPEAVGIVDQAAKNATPAKAAEITVTGHTDTVGSDAYNMRLSRRRAESVAAELEKQGISSSEIAIVAKGKRDLLVPTGDGVREPQNRRVTIVYGGASTS